VVAVPSPKVVVVPISSYAQTTPALASNATATIKHTRPFAFMGISFFYGDNAADYDPS
jgi:hypothetical protein